MAAIRDDHPALPDLDLSRIDFSTRTTRCLRKAGVHTVRELVALRSGEILKWRNAGRKTLTEIEEALASLGLTLADRRGKGTLAAKPIGEIASPRQLLLIEEALPSSASSLLEEGLLSLVRMIATERNAQILVRLWGWSGANPRTLDSVGKEFALTRERIRQIEARALARLSKYRLDTRFLGAAIDALKNAVPDLERNLASALRDAGISRCPFMAGGLEVAAAHCGLRWPFEFLEMGDARFLVNRGEAVKYGRVLSAVRKNTSNRGCMNVLSLASDIHISENSIAGLKRVLEVTPKIQWLDESKEWLYSPDSPRNRLFNICSKVLGVASKVHLSELRRAASRSRRLGMCPPQKVLGAFIEQSGLGRLDGATVIANVGSGIPPAEESAEGIMLSVLDKHGPVMDGEEFAEHCIAAGMNATTFYIYRHISPVICPLGKNVFCKVGVSVPPGTVEQILRQRRTTARVSDYGWTSTGRLWFGIELSRQVIVAGGIRMPSFVSELVQGEWRVILPDGSEHGEVTCKDLFVWSLRKAFAVLGAEPTDLAAFEFDLKARTMSVRIGGPDLFEAMQATEGPNDVSLAEDGVEDA